LSFSSFPISNLHSSFGKQRFYSIQIGPDLDVIFIYGDPGYNALNQFAPFSIPPALLVVLISLSALKNFHKFRLLYQLTVYWIKEG
jgi:hypothetical protein